MLGKTALLILNLLLILQQWAKALDAAPQLPRLHLAQWDNLMREERKGRGRGGKKGRGGGGEKGRRKEKGKRRKGGRRRKEGERRGGEEGGGGEGKEVPSELIGSGPPNSKGSSGVGTSVGVVSESSVVSVGSSVVGVV